jgi:pimeloyl-ACP methyl ester carboxylesterase
VTRGTRRQHSIVNTRTRCRFGLAASLAFVISSSAAAQGLTACRIPLLQEEAACTTVTVPENRSAAGGRTIPLRVVVLGAREGPRPSANALFYLVGGPGLAATKLADLVAATHAATRASHDIVLVDHRGTGASAPLDCTMRDTSDVASYFRDQFGGDEADRCARQLARVADLSQYTAVQAATDLEAVRERLGYERVDLDASSYGTRVALEYMRQFPARVRSVVLQGVVPEDVWLPRTAADDTERAFDRVAADCAKDPFCRTSFPSPRRELATVLSGLRERPIQRVKHPRSDDSLALELRPHAFADRVRVMLYSARLSRRIPLVIHRASENDWTPFVTIAYELGRAMFDPLNNGAHLAAMCADANLMPSRARASNSFLGDSRARMYERACAQWPKTPIAAKSAITSRAPVLLVTGELDPVTPPRFAEAVTKSLPNATAITVPGMAHAGADRCVNQIVSEFVRRGRLDGVDTACLTQLKAPEFVTSW